MAQETKKARGFSVLELVVVVSILTILASTITPHLTRLVMKSRLSRPALEKIAAIFPSRVVLMTALRPTSPTARSVRRKRETAPSSSRGLKNQTRPTPRDG